MLHVGKITSVGTAGAYVMIPDSGGIFGPLHSFVPFESLSVDDQVFVEEYTPYEEGFVVAAKVMAGADHLYTTPYTSVTATYSVESTDYIVDCPSGTFTVTLPTAVDITGRTFTIKNSGVGTITVGTTSSQTIDGTTTKSLSTQYQTLTVVSNGANWICV